MSHSPVRELRASQLEPLQLQSTPELIADRLRSEILEGRFAPDVQLSEVEISRQLKVSRGPIREAMQRLIQEGLLRYERNRGVFVVQLDQEDARDVYLARAAVERAAAAVVARQQSPATLDALQEIVNAIAASVGEPWGDLIGHDLFFHQSLVEAAGSRRLSRMFSTLCAETRLCLLRLEPFYDSATEVAAEHQAILDALRAGNVEAVDQLIQQHMDAATARLSAE
jgi:DNA-binding GntR family transcriptional regulator